MFHGGIPSPPISYFDLGPLRIHFYALCIVVGIGIACWVTNSRLVRRGFESGSIIDIAIWAVPIGIVGGRFYHVFTHPNDYFYAGANLLNVFAIWEGGLAIFGSILFGTLGAYIGCRRAKVSFSAFADAVIPGLLLAQAFGRLGNYFNQELYGGPTTLPWGLQISPDNAAYPAGVPAGTLFQPLFLYEMVWNVLGAVLILTIGRRLALKRGQTAGFYFLWYGSARAFLEWLRIDPTEFHLFGLKINEDVAIAAAIMGLIIIVVSGRRGHPDLPDVADLAERPGLEGVAVTSGPHGDVVSVGNETLTRDGATDDDPPESR